VWVANRYLYLVRHGEATAGGGSSGGGLSDAGERQAALVGQRLKGVPLSAVHHSPLPRAVRTARLIAEQLPDVPVHSSDLLGDYIPCVPDPSVPDRAGLLPAQVELFASYSAAELAEGAVSAAAAVERYAVAAEVETHELIVTHSFLIGWFVRHALDAPPGRWLGLNAGNCALTVIAYRPARPPALVTFNDMSHLPPPLRWTGFPPELRV
jgi:probable phosphoglycerate mutase